MQLVSKWFIVFINTLSFKQVTSCSKHSIVTTFRGAVIKVEVANFCAAMDTLIDQDETTLANKGKRVRHLSEKQFFTLKDVKITLMSIQ